MAMVAIVAGSVGGLPTSAPRLASAAVGEAHVAVRDGYLYQPTSASLSTVNGGIGVNTDGLAGLAVVPPPGQSLQAGPPVVVGPEGGSTIWFPDPCFGLQTKQAQILQVETDGMSVQRFAARTSTDCNGEVTIAQTIAYHATVDVPAVTISPDEQNGSTITVSARIGETARHLVTISNVGNTATPARLAFPGAAVAGVSFDTGTCGASVAPGTTCQLGLVFRPTTAGTVQSTPVVVSDATEWAGPGIGTLLPQGVFFVGRPTPSFGDAVTPIDPVRLLDTRIGNGAPIAPLDQSPLRVQIAGRDGIPMTATAVMANLTVTETTGDGYLTVWPSCEPRPVVSNLNFRPGDTVPNAALLTLGADGSVQVFNSSGLSHVIIDIVAWLAPTGDLVFEPLSAPSRLADTREPGVYSGAIGPGQELSVRFQPGGAEALVVNITGTLPTTATHLTAYGKHRFNSRPNASTLNLRAGETRANLAVVDIADFRDLTVYNNSGSVHVVIDVIGFFKPADDVRTAGRIVPLSPFRSVDTREADDVFGPYEGGGYRFPTDFGGRGLKVGAIIFNTTVTEPTGDGFVTMFPWATDVPLSSSLNFVPGQTVPNQTWVRLSPEPDNFVGVFNGSAGDTHVVLDVQGVILL